jgi:hypothetical protein
LARQGILWSAVVICCALEMGIANASTITVANNSFETPSCGTCYAPGGASWTFSATAGIMGNGNLDIATPDGVQTGWLQYVGGVAPVISQTLTGFTIGNSYNVNFDYAMRTTAADAEPFVVSMDANTLGTFTPGSPTWSNVTSASFVATATSYTLTFTGAKPVLTASEADSNIDLVTVNDLGVISGTPEPASFVMFGSAFLLIGLGLRKSPFALVRG